MWKHELNDERKATLRIQARATDNSKWLTEMSFCGNDANITYQVPVDFEE